MVAATYLRQTSPRSESNRFRSNIAILELIFFPLPCASASWKEEIKFTKLKPYIKYTVKPVLRGHLWVKEKWSFKTGDLLKKVQFIWNFLWLGKKRMTFKYRWLLNRGDHMNRFDCSSESIYHICLCILNITVSHAPFNVPDISKQQVKLTFF